MAVKSKVVGGKAAVKNLKKLGPKGQKAMAGAVYAEGLHVLADSVPRTPVVSGRLRSSRFASIPGGRRLTMLVGYGTKYAWPVHEGIKRRIKDSPRKVQKAFWASLNGKIRWKVSEVGGSKFLERAVDATSRGRNARIQRSFNRLLAKNQGVQPSSTPTKAQE